MDNKILLQDITEFLCRRSGITKREAEQFVRSFFEVIQQGLERDQYVKIKGFGTFKLVEVGQRESVNIKTGERFQINGHTKVSFTPDNSLKDLVNRPFSHFQTVILNDETAIEELEACTIPEDLEQPYEEDSPVENQLSMKVIAEEIPSKDEATSEKLQPKTVETISETMEQEEQNPASINTNQPTACDDATPESMSELTPSLATSENVPASTDEPLTIAEESLSADDNNEQPGVIVPMPLSTLAETEEQSVSIETSLEESAEDSEVMPAEESEVMSEAESEVIPEEVPEEMPEEESQQTEEPFSEVQNDLSSTTLPPTPSPELLTAFPPQKSEEHDEETEIESPNPEFPDDELDSISTIDTERGMQYLVSPKAMDKLKRWKTISIILFVLLVFISTFTLSLLPEYFISNEVQHTDKEKTPQIEDEDNTYAADTSATEPQSASDTTDVDLITPANVDSFISNKRIASQKAEKANRAVATAMPSPSTDNRQATKQAPQPMVNRGSYKITGLRSTHVVARGETLMSIAEREYGSKSLAIYIANYNGLKDANNVHAGTTLRLPELQPK